MNIMESIDGALEVLAGNIQSQPSRGQFQAALLRGQQSPSFSLMSGGQEPPPMQPMAPQQQMPPQPQQPPYDPQRPLRRAVAQAQQQRPPMLQQQPQAMPQQQPPQPQQSETDAILMQDYQRLMSERQRAAEQEQQALRPVDPARMQEMVQQRQQAAQQQTMMALAAQQAGEGFDAFQRHALGQAAQARAPLRMTGGTLTSEGWVADEYAAHELAIKRADAKVRSIDMALERNVTAQQRAELQRERTQAQKDAQHERTEGQKFIAALVHGGGAGGVNAAGGGEVGSTPTGAPVFRTKTGSLITYEGGQPKPYTGEIGAKRENQGHANDSERLAAGFHQRMVTVSPRIDELEAKGRSTATTQNLQQIPFGIGDYMRTLASDPKQQQYYRAAMDWIRAKLRKESGAVIGAQEAADEFATYFPMPGEGPEVVAMKRQARRTAENAMLTASGRASGQAGAMPQGGASGDGHPDGSTATGPGGQKMIKRNGSWVPQ